MTSPTLEEMNAAICEWLGWTREPDQESPAKWWWKSPNPRDTATHLPSHHTDLNACALAASKLQDDKRLMLRYLDTLSKMTADDGNEDVLSLRGEFLQTEATASQRTRALYQVITATKGS